MDSRTLRSGYASREVSLFPEVLATRGRLTPRRAKPDSPSTNLTRSTFPRGTSYFKPFDHTISSTRRSTVWTTDTVASRVGETSSSSTPTTSRHVACATATWLISSASGPTVHATRKDFVPWRMRHHADVSRRTFPKRTCWYHLTPPRWEV